MEEKLLSDLYYYKYIFKKTEKIVCAVFYTLRNQKDNKEQDSLHTDIEETAQKVLSDVLRTLSFSAHSVSSILEVLVYRILSLESKLRVLYASGVLSAEILHVFTSEIEGVLRSIEKYRQGELNNPIYSTNDSSTLPGKQLKQKKAIGLDGGRNRSVAGIASQGKRETLLVRRDRIKEVLTEKGQASIRDISDVVNDCSEKTIQRELNDMIKDNIVQREGERRWSKYLLV